MNSTNPTAPEQSCHRQYPGHTGTMSAFLGVLLFLMPLASEARILLHAAKNVHTRASSRQQRDHHRRTLRRSRTKHLSPASPPPTPPYQGSTVPPCIAGAPHTQPAIFSTALPFNTSQFVVRTLSELHTRSHGSAICFYPSSSTYSKQQYETLAVGGSQQYRFSRNLPKKTPSRLQMTQARTTAATLTLSTATPWPMPISAQSPAQVAPSETTCGRGWGSDLLQWP